MSKFETAGSARSDGIDWLCLKIAKLRKVCDFWVILIDIFMMSSWWSDSYPLVEITQIK